MQLDPGTSFGTVSAVNTALVEVPETGTYKSADNTQSRFYRAGDRVSRQEYELLQMGGVEIAGEVEPETEASNVTVSVEPVLIEDSEIEPEAEPEPEAKAAPKPSNKKAAEPENKSE